MTSELPELLALIKTHWDALRSSLHIEAWFHFYDDSVWVRPTYTDESKNEK